MSRYGLLECGKNFKGTHEEICNVCVCLDDENHRINHFEKWKANNLYNSTEKIDFNIIYSNDLAQIQHVTRCVNKIWDTRSAHGKMHQ